MAATKNRITRINRINRTKKRKTSPATPPVTFIGSVRVPIRISGSVTSISLRKNLVALWILLSDMEPKDYKSPLTDFIYKCSDSWKENTAKGFSEFISEKLIESILDSNDYVDYKKILAKI